MMKKREILPESRYPNDLSKKKRFAKDFIKVGETKGREKEGEGKGRDREKKEKVTLKV
jgi:hypothetical protein